MSKKLPKNKRQVLVYLSEDIYRMLITLAPQLYGKARGGMSFVVEEALKQYLLPLAGTHTREHAGGGVRITANPKASVRLVYGQVVEKLKEMMRLPFKPMQVAEKLLDAAIAETRGPTVVDRWKGYFARQGLIKFVAGSRPNRVVELL
jgi:hypothetical protein